MKSDEGFTTADIASAINNAFVYASRPQDAEISESRLERIHAYAHAIIQAMEEDIESGDITKHEMTVALLGAALYNHIFHTLKESKLPAFRAAYHIIRYPFCDRGDKK